MGSVKGELVKTTSQSAWHFFPVLGKVLPRDLSLLKLLLGQGEEKVSPLRGWGDVPMRDFFEQPQNTT